LRIFSFSIRVLESFNSNWLPSLRLTVTRLFGPVRPFVFQLKSGAVAY
jgi:hypothetical protein